MSDLDGKLKAMRARIQHVSIPRPAGSDSAVRAFYGELLGFEEVPPPKSLTGVIWYRLGDTELHLFTEDPDGRLRGQHLCIEVADLQGIRGRLEGAGYETRDTTVIPGRPRFFCRDPFGNLIEFTRVEGNYLELEGESP